MMREILASEYTTLSFRMLESEMYVYYQRADGICFDVKL